MTSAMTAKAPHTQHFATLDGLRGAAAFVVLLLHARQILHMEIHLPHAFLAVDFFFMLSGFVIAKAYEARLKSSMSFRRFVLIRLIRFYPLVLVGAILGALVFAARSLTTHAPAIGQILTAVFYALIFLPTSVLLSLHPEEIYPVNPPEWSLLFELIINFMYAPLARWLTTPRLISICVLSGTALCLIVAFNNGLKAVGFQPMNFMLPFARVMFSFCAGVLLFRYRPAWGLGGGASIALGAGLMVLLMTSFFAENWLYEMTAILIVFPVIVLFGSVCKNGPRLNKICILFGELSYPLYITHHPVLRIIANGIDMLHVNVAPDVAVGLCLIMSILIAALLLKFWDKPVRKWLSSILQTRLAQ